MAHIPVLSKEVAYLLNVHEGDVVLDGTLNGGGHARELVHAIGGRGTFIGIEWDKDILEKTNKELLSVFSQTHNPQNILCVWGNYKDAPNILKKLGIDKVSAILLDLGFSSHQIDDPLRGFSFQHDGPLDMRYNTQAGDPAYTIVNSFDEGALADILFVYGQERQSRKIAHAIVEYRKKERIMYTGQLRSIIEQSCARSGNKKINPATKTFQALRIYVNNELGNLKEFLQNLPQILAPRGRCAIISFHSLEDRMVKDAFRKYKKQGIANVLTKKPITPSDEEILKNPRSRSAKLRVIEML